MELIVLLLSGHDNMTTVYLHTAEVCLTMAQNVTERGGQITYGLHYVPESGICIDRQTGEILGHFLKGKSLER